MKNSITITSCLFFFIFLLSSVPANTQPDAGSVLRDQAPADRTIPDRLPSDVKKGVETPAPADAKAVVRITGFRFTGHEGIAPEAELQELVKASIGRELAISGLRRLTAIVTNYLRDEKGYFLARAYLPEQDITEGIITIAIISAKIDGKVEINIKEPSRIKPSLLQGIADRAVPEDGPVRMQQMERAILFMRDLPGIDASASVGPGKSPGSSRVVINASEGRLFNGQISGDNYGDRYTGTYCGTGGFSLSDPLGFGDELSLSLRKAEHLDLWRVAYSIPVGSTGFTINSSYTGLSYELGKDLAALDAGGEASALAADINYPLILSRNTRIRTGVGFERFTLEDEVSQEKTSDRVVGEGRLFITGNFWDRFFGGGLTSAYFVLGTGDVDLSGLPANEAIDDTGPETSGDYSRGTYYISRLQRVTRLVSLYASVRGQFASGNLDSSRKFILGGPRGVRAYPVGEAAGDEGHIFTFETRVDLPFMPSWAATQMVVFFDAGRIRLHKDPWPGSITNISGKNSYSLSGAGIGFNIASNDRYSMSVSYAHEIGPNDGESVNGNDADNLDNNNRFWLNLTIRF